MAPRLTQVRVLGGFTLIAILLAGTGIYGLLAFAVSNRSQEIGVRMAVGAQSKDILRMILRESLALACAGTIIGIGLAYLAAHSLQSILAGVQPGDPRTYAAGVVIALCTSLAGSILPAIRALRVDPMTAIRAE
jgi:putative ABC transport system permease protein